MSPFGITGYSTSGKTPINYGLKAGQFRMPKYSVFQNKTVINNNIFGSGYGGFNYGYYDNSCCNNSMPGWTKWLMGLGGATTLLGGILNLFAPQKSELGGTDPKTEQPAADEFAGLKEKYPNGEFIKITDNRYNAVVDSKEYNGSSIAELYDNIQNGRTTTSTEPPTKTDPEVVEKPYWAITTAYEQDRNTNGVVSPAKFEEGIISADIFNALTGVYDYGKDENGREIGDFEEATAEVNNKEYKNGDEITIGGYKYKIKIEHGYVFLEDIEATAAGNEQVYILEKRSDGSYQLAQRDFIHRYTKGVGKIAHHNK